MPEQTAVQPMRYPDFQPLLKSLEFTNKIGQTILRYRVAPTTTLPTTATAGEEGKHRIRTKSEIGGKSGKELHNRRNSEPTAGLGGRSKEAATALASKELNLDLNSVEFWRNGIPIHIDIFASSSSPLPYIVERWVLSFQENILPTPTNTHFVLDANASPDESAPFSPTVVEDMTDLILLIQSLYAEIRSLPLASAIAQNQVSKTELRYGITFAHGTPIKHTSSFMSANDTSTFLERAFHPAAKLEVFKFRPAAGPRGTLCMHVVHDLNLSGLSIPLFSSSPSTTPTSTDTRRKSPPSLNLDMLDIAGIKLHDREKRRTSGAGSIISAGTFVHSPTLQPNPNDAQPSEQQERVQDLPPPPPMERKISNAPDSPFPSPKAQKRVLAYSQPRLDASPSTPRSQNQRPIPPPIRVKSNLHFNFSNTGTSDSGLDGSSNAEGNDTILTPDGIEIHRSSFSESPPKEVPIGKETRRNMARRDSLPAAASDLFGTFVGSYEESILIGRLSTSPSRPIPFLAEIGVLAIGKCKPALKCPPHLSVGFSAYFYQLPDEDVPTPYVGTIDVAAPHHARSSDKLVPECLGYMIPLKGQLQIMIKNPSCTAIKVFLIPYDFRDMPANTKTFIRQKSYAISTSSPTHPGTPSSSRANYSRRGSIEGTPLPNPDRLKFAIHLHFQMNSKKNLYLTSQIRLVFSPRPLDGDEKLKIVYQAPNFPKYQTLSPLVGASPSFPGWPHGEEAPQVQGR